MIAQKKSDKKRKNYGFSTKVYQSISNQVRLKLIEYVYINNKVEGI